MESRFEAVRYNEALPARIEIFQGNVAIEPHWHKEIELVYVMDGEVDITVSHRSNTVSSDSFLLINSAESHSIAAENAKCLILDISYEFAQQFDDSMYHTVFEVIGGSGAEEELHNLLWQLSRTVSEKELPGLRQYSIITDILHVLFVQCRCENRSVVNRDGNMESRFVKLTLEYIQQHYREEILVKNLAEMYEVDASNFGKYFRQETGVLFQDYVMKVRLEHAMDALLNKDMSIEDAAAAGGFPSKRTFVLKCQKVYGKTPYQMLKEQKTKE